MGILAHNMEGGPKCEWPCHKEIPFMAGLMWSGTLCMSIYEKQKLRITINTKNVKLSWASENLPCHPSDRSKRHREIKLQSE